LVTPQFLAHNRRYALVIAALAAALLTPPDAVSMLLMMVPLVLLYEVSIWCAWVVTRRRARRAQAAARAGIVLLALCGLGAGRLDAAGDPRLFDQGTVLVGEGMRYDTCIRRGTVRSALTTFQQGGATWYTRGDLAVDSGSTRVYGASSEITSSDLPMPDYHFAAHEVKWLNKNVMVARPAVLYIRDVPILWLPFIFQDIRPGRRSGILVPRFGLNDLVRPTG